jgi:hypothetical protein
VSSTAIELANFDSIDAEATTKGREANLPDREWSANALDGAGAR